MQKPTAVIFDVDGTLANVDSIRHYVLDHLRQNKDFNKFHEESVNVPTHEQVVEMVRKAYSEGHSIIIVTARMAKWRNHTAMWLAVNNVYSDAMYMRKDGDERPDYEVKKEILTKIQRTWEVIHAVDDSPKVTQLWIDNGISTTIIPGWID